MITSRNNAKIKQIRALLKRSVREQTGLALLEGWRLVTEALRYPQLVQQLIVAPELLKSQLGQTLLQDQRQKGLPTLCVSTEVFLSFSLKDNPQGIAAVVSQQWNRLEQIRLSTNDCWIALEAIQNPGNLGTILRTCDAVGCRGAFLLDHTTDAYDPTALRASMGAIFSLRLVKTSFQAFADWKRLHHYPVVGTSDAATLNYRHAHYPSPLILLMGSERQGLSSAQQAFCDFTVGIPMQGSSDSLNVSIAAAVVLYEILHHWRK
ncbi:RNA methyltransferase [Ktedonosporobacter rubrisoli]|uniref:RNA methyltransferase n=1 Tax=Ktedonosporobacter rubrisoli TaxID=2509675 RepID=A0A4P6K595_KTERU|nr:RNA methyltransferase [Ktedonosporobacter rubrisoli]